jgi:phospholipid transport system substrate-binding protein
MRKHFFTSLLILLMGFAFLLPRVAAANDPVNMLQSVADQMIASLKTHKATLATHPSVVYSLSYKIVVPHADLDEMSKRVLPAQTWAQATPAQRSAFKKEFTTLLVRTYASALAEYTDETVRFYPVRGGYQGKSSVVVESQIIRSNGPSIPVSYRVVNTGGSWRLYDMSVEGVSMLQSFRSQFADKLSGGNMAELISALKQHNANNG